MLHVSSVLQRHRRSETALVHIEIRVLQHTMNPSQHHASKFFVAALRVHSNVHKPSPRSATMTMTLDYFLHSCSTYIGK